MVKTDSEYAGNGVTEGILKRARNGLKTTKGAKVVNHESSRLIDHQTVELDRAGIRVLFWHVPRDQNWQAESVGKPSA